MKKLTKLVTSCSLGALTIMATSCNLLFQAAKKIAEYEPGQVQYTDDHTSLEITKPGLYKIEKFHVDVSELAKNYPESQLYTYQINKGTSSIKAKKQAYIKNITWNTSNNYSGLENEEVYANFTPVASSVEPETFEPLKFYENGGTNLIPEFAADMYRNPEKYLTEAANRSRSSGERFFLTKDLFETDENGEYNLNFFVATENGGALLLEGETKVGELMYEGEHCIVFRAKNETFYEDVSINKDGKNIVILKKGEKVSMTSIRNIADRFDDIYSQVIGIMGSTDTSGSKLNGVLKDNYDKIVIFINDIIDDHSSGYGVGGYFYSGDLLNNPYSNQCRMINIDSYFLEMDTVLGTRSSESTLAHEFTHMCNYINKVLLNANGENLSWFTEMMAMTCEDILSYQIDPKGSQSSVFNSRLPYFNYGYCLGFNNWNNNYNDQLATLITYGNTYAMGAFFLRNFAPTNARINFINEIATNKYIGVEAIGAALWENGYFTGDFETYADVFNQVYNLFPQVLINAGYSDKPTLFISSKEYFNNENYKIEAIDLYDYEISLDQNNTLKGPFKLDKDKLFSSLGSYGFDFHEYGSVKNMKTIDIEREKNRNIEFFIYIK
ncbi:MAG: hypothetical protein MJ181_06100 [Treponema sp.]|nr:hypothetical protein [Treponema sp.]